MELKMEFINPMRNDQLKEASAVISLSLQGTNMTVNNNIGTAQ